MRGAHPAQRLLVMALLGPVVVVAEHPAADFIDVLGKAGAFPIAQTRWADVPAAVAETQPVALAIGGPPPSPPPFHVLAALQCIPTPRRPAAPILPPGET